MMGKIRSIPQIHANIPIQIHLRDCGELVHRARMRRWMPSGHGINHDRKARDRKHRKMVREQQKHMEELA